jgi:VanZ family protein
MFYIIILCQGKKSTDTVNIPKSARMDRNRRMKGRKRRLISWLWASFCILAIFLVIPLARNIQIFVSARWGSSLFGYAVLAAVGTVSVLLFFFLFFRRKIRRVSNYFWLLLVTVLYVYFTIKLWDVPVEAIHFLEYGLLGFFLFRALKFNIRDKSIFFIAFLIGTLVGIFDEILQWIVPLRLWDIRDVGLNALSGGLFQIWFWKGIQPQGISSKIKPKSWKILSLMLGANIVLLGLCLSNTPKRVSTYTEAFSSLSFLKKEEPMNRFKHRYKDPAIGIFYSLLSPADLTEEDTKLSRQNAQILKEWKRKTFKEFRQYHHPFIFPFIYELRFHVEIRDRNFNQALLTEKEDSKKMFFLAAYKENLILKKYFGDTLQKASYSWEKEKQIVAEASIDKNNPYKSPVSFGIVFPWSEKTMWLLIFALLIILFLLNLLYSRHR